MKNLSPADVILEVKVLKRGREFVLMQSHYIENVLRKFNHFDCKPSKTPIDPHVKLVPNEGTTINQGEYAKIIESNHVCCESHKTKSCMCNWHIKQIH